MRMLCLMLVFMSIVSLLSIGCMGVSSPAIGLIYTDVKGPISGNAASGTKHGQACATSILALFATGDASIDAAKKAGGISEVVAVDHYTKNILGIYGEYCTIVTGK